MVRAAPNPACEAVQVALVEGEDPARYRAHLGACDECSFFLQLSRSEVRSQLGAGQAGPLGAFEWALQQAHQHGEPLLGRYKLEQLLGTGGQGQVWRAVDQETNEPVAIKFVRLGSGKDSALEVANARKVHHPYVCRVYHTERHGTVRFIVMELVKGPTLAQRLPKLDRATALRCFRRLCEGVAAAHAAGVLHLDLKPGNVLLRRDDEPVLTDFGLSVGVGEAASARGGTLVYMAPEQRRGQPVDPRADVYALGRILSDVLGPRKSPYGRIIARATAEDPERRFADIHALQAGMTRAEGTRRLMLGLAVAMVLLPAMALGARMTLRLWLGAPSGAIILSGQVPGGGWDPSVEAYDQDTGELRALADVPDRALCHTRALVAGDGDIYLMGGGGPPGCADNGTTTQRVRRFHPGTGRWTQATCQRPCMRLPQGGTVALEPDGAWEPAECRPEGPCLQFGRNKATTLTLASGDLFVLAGCAGGCAGPNGLGQTLVMNVGGVQVDLQPRTAEIYDLRKQIWRLTPPSSEPHVSGVAVQVGGFVLVCGGNDGYLRHVQACERYDLNSHFNGAPAWTDAGPLPRRGTPLMVAFEDMVVLAVWDDESRLWNNGWQPAVALARPQPEARLQLLPSGRALLAGGRREGIPIPDAQIFERDPTATGGGRWRSVAAMIEARQGQGMALLPNGRVLAVGGCTPGPSGTTELFDPATATWTQGPRLAKPRCQPEVVPLRPQD